MFSYIRLFFSKIPKLHIDRFKFIILVDLIITCVENIPAFINRYNINFNANYDMCSNIYALFIEALILFALMLIILFIISWSRWLLKIVVAIFFAFNSIFIYMLVAYKVVINEVLFLNILQAPSGEVTEINLLKPIIVFIFVGLLPALYVIFFVYIKKPDKGLWRSNFLNVLEQGLKKITCIIFIPILLCLMIVMLSKKEIFFHNNTVKSSLIKYIPLNYIASYYQYITKLKQDIKLAENITDITNEHTFTFDSPLKEKPLTIVLIIGESAGYKQQAYSGYHRDTNAYTKNIPGLVYLKNVKACNTYTAYSVPCMLSYKTRKEFSMPSTETGLISVFNSLGFKTYWISTQTAYSRGLNPIFRSASEASVFHFVYSVRNYLPSGAQVYDELSVNTLFKDAVNSNFKHKLIVFQLAGSHINYKERFPEKFMVYTPSSKITNKTSDDITQNDYDNSVLYTDYVLSEIIKLLKDKNSLLLYMSDHGESLPNDKSGFLIHGTPYEIAPKEQTHVAALMWLSPSMQKLLPNALNNMKIYGNLPISHDYIYSTLLGSIGVKSDTINENLNLCSEKGLKDAKMGKYH